MSPNLPSKEGEFLNRKVPVDLIHYRWYFWICEKLLTQPVLTVRIIHLHLGDACIYARYKNKNVSSWLYIREGTLFVLWGYIFDALGFAGVILFEESLLPVILLWLPSGSTMWRLWYRKPRPAWLGQKINNCTDKVNVWIHRKWMWKCYVCLHLPA